MALDLFRRAAARGNVYAQNNIAFMYAFGRGTALNYDNAIDWYKKWDHVCDAT